MNKIREAVLFVYATKGEALEIANSAEEELEVVSLVIIRGFTPAKVPVGYAVLTKGWEGNSSSIQPGVTHLGAHRNP